MTSVDLMLEEHRLIERMLEVLEECAERLDRGDGVPAEMLSGMLEFIQVYADAGHHAKEEDLLFPALAAHGLEPDSSSIGAFKAQHVSGRLFVREMRDALPAASRGETAGAQAFAASAQDYIALLREHIRLENHHFAEYAAEYLTPEDDATLRAQMDAVDRARALDVGVDRYPAMVAEFEEALLKC
jgi:hemerythrin-like domain-containing protein